MLNPNITELHIPHAAELARLAEFAYLPANEALMASRLRGYSTVHFAENPQSDTQALVVSDEANVVVALRGTNCLRDVLTDGALCKDAFPGGKVHRGFRAALGSLADELREAVEEIGAGRALWLTGHSLGASLALLAAGEAAMVLDRAIHGVYAFAPPRPGDRDWRVAYDAVLGDSTFCFVRDADVVPRLPPRALGYSHVGQMVLLKDGQMRATGAAWKNQLNVQVDPSAAWRDGSPLEDHRIANYRSDIELIAAEAAGSERTQDELLPRP
jgi:triacylglycerol lipase